MDIISIKIINPNLENDLLLFSINDTIQLCFSKNQSYTVKEFIKNLFMSATKALYEDEEGTYFEIVNTEDFGDEELSYDEMLGKTYTIQCVKKNFSEINYEIEL